MYNSLLKVLALVLFVGALTASCDSGKNGPTLTNKNDSLTFARNVMKAYGGEAILSDQQQDRPAGARTMGKDSMQPISWATYLKYKNYYDKNPLIFNPDNKAYKGYTIDAAGYARLMSNPAIKGLYLRLGRKDDGSYTIMILGTDGSGQVLNSSDSLELGGNGDTNFDNVIPCPTNCPKVDEGD